MNRNINNVNKRFRGFFFTLDARENDGLPSISADAIMAVLNKQDSVENYVFQLERGKQSTDNNENGFLHYQGCIILSRNNPRRPLWITGNSPPSPFLLLGLFIATLYSDSMTFMHYRKLALFCRVYMYMRYPCCF